MISTTPTAVLSFANEALAPSMKQLSEKNSLPFLPIIYQRQGRETGFKASLSRKGSQHTPMHSLSSLILSAKNVPLQNPTMHERQTPVLNHPIWYDFLSPFFFIESLSGLPLLMV